MNMKEFNFYWRKVFFNPCRNGKTRIKKIKALSLDDACKEMGFFLDNYFNVQLGETVQVSNKEISIEGIKCLHHLLSSNVV